MLVRKSTVEVFQETFPGVELVGCNFHHKQAVRRNIQKIGLQGLYGRSEPFQYAVKLFYALTFIKPADVLETFESVVKPAFDDLEKEEWFKKKSEKINQLISYLTRTWIGKI